MPFLPICHSTIRPSVSVSAVEQQQLADIYFEHNVSCIVILDRHYNFVRVNPAYARACRRDIGDFVGRNHFELYPSDTKLIFDEVLRTRKPYETFTRSFVFADQPERGVTYWDWTLVPILDTDGEVQYLVFSLVEVTERKRAEEAALKQIAEIEDLYNNAPCGYHSLDAAGCIVRINQTELNWLGYGRDELLGQPITRVLTPQGVSIFQARFPDILRNGQVTGLDVDFLRKDGQVMSLLVNATAMTDEQGRFVMSRATVYDNTERKRHQMQLEHQANHDALTGLPNRSLLRTKMLEAMSEADRTGGMAAVMFMDLDRFKYVNDSLGHDVGDQLLQETAMRLSDTLRPCDTIARYGGDEFVLVLPQIADIAEVSAGAERMLAAMRQGYLIDDQELVVTTSLGISLYPSDGNDFPTLLRCADMALYRAKDEGRNNYQFFTHNMHTSVAERTRLEKELRHALERQQFRLCYQPQVHLRTGQIVGSEALLRWHHPDFGLVSPLQFIELAEELGLIIPIGAWVLREACKTNKSWQDSGLPPIKVAVNLSARQFRQLDLVECVHQALLDSGLAPGYLELEMTESMIMHDPDRVAAVLLQLSELGVSLAIDDFGTGYSSLAYLKRFPIDKIKIDRSFVRDVTTDADDAAIAKAIISIAQDMKMAVIAEGVETVEQARFLREFGCDQLQGYLFSKPVYGDELRPILLRQDRLEL